MQIKKSNNDTSNILLLLFVVITFVTNISNKALTKYVGAWFEGSIALYAVLCLAFFQYVSYMLPALAIKNKTYRFIGILISSITVIYLVYTLIYAIILLAKNS